MADRQWFAEGVAVYESGTEEYFVECFGISEDQAETGSETVKKTLTLLGVG